MIFVKKKTLNLVEIKTKIIYFYLFYWVSIWSKKYAAFDKLFKTFEAGRSKN